MSQGEETLAYQLRALGIGFEREVRFAAPRRFRFDFVLDETRKDGTGIALEVDGGAWSGGHRRGAEADSECEKNNLAVLDDWIVLHFTPAMIDDGRAIATIEHATGRDDLRG